MAQNISAPAFKPFTNTLDNIKVDWDIKIWEKQMQAPGMLPKRDIPFLIYLQISTKMQLFTILPDKNTVCGCQCSAEECFIEDKKSQVEKGK